MRADEDVDRSLRERETLVAECIDERFRACTQEDFVVSVSARDAVNALIFLI